MTQPLYRGDKTDFYLAPPNVADGVNLAIHLNRPILVEGEPGCGKTMLAYSIAAEKKLGAVTKIPIKSTSRAQDLLYRVNSLRRLQDAQSQLNPNAQFIYPYLSLGPLGNALHQPKRSVVLIDEIDKADIDFPNDLLDVLDTFSFEISDLPLEEEKKCKTTNGFGRKIQSDKKTQPIVVITSNREKRLPEPFLRRCIYVRLLFPRTSDELRDIVRKNTKLTTRQMNEKILKAAIDSFLKVRAKAVGSAQKPPSTSELIDWIRILHWKGKTVQELTKDPELPPYWQLLFKNMSDIDAHEAVAKKSSEAKS
ncbi:MAG TPA: MoxR family ATPase [Pyrinomonadaceae bacterium]|nr:MoxR family ATPase [Pyrinomonadaceae bacterium]